MAKPSDTKQAPQPIKLDASKRIVEGNKPGKQTERTVPYYPDPVYGSIMKVDLSQLPEEPASIAQGFGKADRERRQS